MEMFNSRRAAFAPNSAAAAGLEERLAFLKKVYGLLTISLLTATVGAFFGQALNPGLMFPLFIVEIGLIFFAMAVRRKPVWNLVALFAFTTLSGVTLGPVMLVYSLGAIQEALVLTSISGPLSSLSAACKRHGRPAASKLRDLRSNRR